MHVVLVQGLEGAFPAQGSVTANARMHTCMHEVSDIPVSQEYIVHLPNACTRTWVFSGGVLRYAEVNEGRSFLPI